MRDRRRLLVGLMVLVGTAWSSPVRADSPVDPWTYTVVSPGGKYLFVMLSPLLAEDELRRNPNGAGNEIRRTHSQSGLYRNDGSTVPLWTVDWYAFGVKVASDGVHLIRPGPWTDTGPRGSPLTPALNGEAISFFANGQLLRTYRINELVDDPEQLQRSVSHVRWEKDGQFDDGRMEYTLTTLDGNRFVFDVRTGAIVSESRAPRLSRRPGLVLVLTGAVVAAIGLACWLILRRRARSSEDGKRDFGREPG
jgi:hypothetical protein